MHSIFKILDSEREPRSRREHPLATLLTLDNGHLIKFWPDDAMRILFDAKDL